MAFCKLNNLLTVFGKSLLRGGSGNGGDLVPSLWRPVWAGGSRGYLLLPEGLWGCGVGGTQSSDSEVLGETLRRRAGPGWLSGGEGREGAIQAQGLGLGSRWPWRGAESGHLSALCPASASALCLSIKHLCSPSQGRWNQVPSPGDLGNRHSSSRSPGGWKCEIKVSAGLASPEACLCGLQMAVFLLCPHVPSVRLRTPGVSPCIQSPLITSQTGLGPALRASFSPNPPFKALSPNAVTFWGAGGRLCMGAWGTQFSSCQYPCGQLGPLTSLGVWVQPASPSLQPRQLLLHRRPRGRSHPVPRGLAAHPTTHSACAPPQCLLRPCPRPSV